jgi:hypothetical protein
MTRNKFWGEELPKVLSGKKMLKIKSKHKTKKRTKPKTLLPLTIVQFNFATLPKEFHKHYPFKKNELLLYLGELADLPGHCVVARYPIGDLVSGYHSDNFIKVDLN